MPEEKKRSHDPLLPLSHHRLIEWLVEPMPTEVSRDEKRRLARTYFPDEMAYVFREAEPGLFTIVSPIVTELSITGVPPEVFRDKAALTSARPVEDYIDGGPLERE
ncbi:hypothetical protein [Brevundimonas lutea]|uniref:hypothetical protein n=1 Tax=Brevundimonas lutea TaxID=2293980 RepID=UPI000F01BCAB|nr:hypothetical protein [Brevundimonas lutea]